MACGHNFAHHATLFGTLLLAIGCDAQGHNMAGGQPPAAVQTQLCTISSVFAHLQTIKTAPDCTAGCAGGGPCPTDWYPGNSDTCNAACGRIFEPFWYVCISALLYHTHPCALSAALLSRYHRRACWCAGTSAGRC
jgi:hypothetical protein